MATVLGYWLAVSAGLGGGWVACKLISAREADTLRGRLRAALSRNRHEVLFRGHAWDVADVMAVYDTEAEGLRHAR